MYGTMHQVQSLVATSVIIHCKEGVCVYHMMVALTYGASEVGLMLSAMYIANNPKWTNVCCP